MTPYSYQVACDGCNAKLLLGAIRDHEERTKTAFTVSCPACHNDVDGQMPLSVMLASIQIVSFELPDKKKKN